MANAADQRSPARDASEAPDDADEQEREIVQARDAMQAGALMAAEARALQGAMATYSRLLAGRQYKDVPSQSALVLFTNLVRAIASLGATLRVDELRGEPFVLLPGTADSAETATLWLGNAIESLIDLFGLGTMRTTQALQLSFFPAAQSGKHRPHRLTADDPDVGEVCYQIETHTFPQIPPIVAEEVAYAVEMLEPVSDVSGDVADEDPFSEGPIPARRLKDHWLVWCWFVAREQSAAESPEVQSIEPRWYFQVDPPIDSP